MRRRFWLSRRSAEIGVGRVAATVERLQQHLMGRDVYLSSRGYVSTDSHGWRRHVGFVGGVAAAEASGHWVVEVETTEEYEARQHEVVGGVTTGRQDLDAVEAIRLQLEAAATYDEARSRGYGMAAIHAQTAQAMRPNNLFQNEVLTYSAASNQIIQPGQFVYATSDGTVTATPSRHSPVVGTFVRMEGNNAVVALHGGGAVTMQVSNTATASDVAAAAQQANIAAVAMQFTAISYTDRTEVAEVRGTSPLPVGYTTGSYTASIPITIHGDLDDLAAAMERQSRELAAAARRRQDEATRQALATSRPVRFPIAGPVTDERTQRICDIVERISREAAQRYLGEPIQVDPHTTHITEPERRRIEEGVTAALRQRLDGDLRLVVDREMRAGQLQTHIVGSTTGERRWDNVYDWNPSQGVVAAPLTGTVRLTNTSSEAYVIAPGALAVSAAPGAPTTWYNTDETTLPPGGVVDVPVHSVTATSSEPLTHVRSALPGVMASSPVAQWQQSDILRFATLSRPSGSDLDVIAEQRYGLERATGETDADLRSRCQLRWAERLPRDVSLTRTYIVDAVEVSPDPSCAAWLPRLLLWLGNEVAADDAVLRGLSDEIAASGQQVVLVYVAERRALRVETRKEWLEAGGSRVAWSTIQDRAATSAP